MRTGSVSTIVDGNAIAGMMLDIFGSDVTGLFGICDGCGSEAQFARAVVELDRHLTGQAEAGVVDLAGVGSRDRLDVLGPTPARLEDTPPHGEVAERDDVHVAVGLVGPRLVGGVHALLR